jgi:hypothetical protein
MREDFQRGKFNLSAFRFPPNRLPLFEGKGNMAQNYINWIILTRFSAGHGGSQRGKIFKGGTERIKFPDRVADISGYAGNGVSPAEIESRYSQQIVKKMFKEQDSTPQVARNQRIFGELPLFGAIKKQIKTNRFVEIRRGTEYTETCGGERAICQQFTARL